MYEARQAFFVRQGNPVGPVHVHDHALDGRDIRWIVEGMIPERSVIMMAGSPKLGRKSLLAMHLAMCVASGKPFLGYQVQRHDVLYVCLEDGYERVARRLRDMGGTDPMWRDHQLFVYHGIEGMRAAMRVANEAPVLTILDPLIRITNELNFDENNPNHMDKLVEFLRIPAHTTGGSVLPIHHFRKAGDMMRGSSALQGTLDGWVECTVAARDTIKMSWTLRDGSPGELGVRVTHIDRRFGFERVDLASLPTESGAEGAAARSRGDSAILEQAIATAMLRTSGMALSRDAIATSVGRTSSSRPFVRAFDNMLSGNTIVPDGKGAYRLSDNVVSKLTRGSAQIDN